MTAGLEYTTTVYLAVTDQIADVVRDGADHSVLGALFDLGTVAALTGYEQDPAAQITRLCRQADPEGGTLRLTTLSDDRLRAGTDLRAELEKGIADAAVCVILVPPDAAQPPLALVSGVVLPAMGVTADCPPERLLATFRHLAGSPEWQTETLFTETVVPASIMEEQLSERLRQLYGE